LYSDKDHSSKKKKKEEKEVENRLDMYSRTSGDVENGVELSRKEDLYLYKIYVSLVRMCSECRLLNS
jgi:hypothetical protein